MKKIFFIMFSILLFSCYNKIENNNSLQSIAIEKEKLDELKNLVLTEYNKNDSIYFTQIENKNFKKFVTNDFDSTNLYFDIILEGISLKYFYSYTNDFNFLIIRGNNNIYKYLGLIDIKLYEKKIDSLYLKNNSFTYKFLKDTLIIIESSYETLIINSFYTKNFIKPSEKEFLYVKMLKLLHYFYRDRMPNSYNYKYFDIIISFDELTEILKINEKDFPLTFKQISDFYFKLNNSNDNFIIYNYKGLGALIFKISNFKIEKILIPSKTISKDVFISNFF